MKYLYLLTLFTVSVCASYGQKIQGVYVGKILSERNALIVETDGSQVTGDVYVSQNEHFHFTGTYNKPELKGAIVVDSSRKIIVEGSLKGNSLTLNFLDNLEMKNCTVRKISTKVGVQTADLFSDQQDMLLLGVWETFKRTDGSGNDISDPGAKLIYQYNLHGSGEGRLIGTPRLPPGRTGTGVSGPIQMTFNWATHDGLLDQTEHHQAIMSFDGTIHYVLGYSINNDTLVTRSPNTNLTYWKRK